MKNFRKIGCVLLSLIMCLCAAPVYANNNQIDVPINMDSLEAQMEIAISQGEEPVTTASLKNQETGLTYDVEVYALPIAKDRNFTSEDNGGSICYVASTEYMSLDESTIPISARKDGSHDDGGWDRNGSAYFAFGFDFDRNYDGYIQLTYLWGNATLYDGVGFASSTVGANQESPYVGVHDRNWWNVGSSFGIHTGFGGWVPDSSASTFGASWQTTLSRFGETWDFSLPIYRYL